jgi:hypothetical protein
LRRRRFLVRPSSRRRRGRLRSRRRLLHSLRCIHRLLLRRHLRRVLEQRQAQVLLPRVLHQQLRVQRLLPHPLRNAQHSLLRLRVNLRELRQLRPVDFTLNARSAEIAEKRPSKHGENVAKRKCRLCP